MERRDWLAGIVWQQQTPSRDQPHEAGRNEETDALRKSFSLISTMKYRNSLPTSHFYDVTIVDIG